jgi:adenosylcobinamide-GDP ribazoletransferase
MNIIYRFLVCASCITALPLVRLDETVPLNGLAKYLSSVGIVIGILLALFYAGLIWLNAPALFSAVVICLVWIAITGAMHLDGLMDTGDGIFSHRSAARMLEIMQDSRVGNFGVLSGLSVILIKIACLATLSPKSAILSLIVVPSWARLSETIAITCFPYARPSGMGKIWHDTARFPVDLFIGSLVPLTATILLCLTYHCLVPALAGVFAITCGVAAAFYIQKMIAGHTGDTYGAVVELSESGALIMVLLAPLLWQAMKL